MHAADFAKTCVLQFVDAELSYKLVDPVEVPNGVISCLCLPLLYGAPSEWLEHARIDRMDSNSVLQDARSEDDQGWTALQSLLPLKETSKPAIGCLKSLSIMPL